MSLQVAGLFRDASIGNAVNIIIVRLVLLEEDEVSGQCWRIDGIMGLA